MRRSILFPTILWIVLLIATSACRAPECQQMADCCSVVEEMDGVGAACGELASDTRDPLTCRDVVRTISYMLEDSEQPVPQSCRL